MDIHSWVCIGKVDKMDSYIEMFTDRYYPDKPAFYSAEADVNEKDDAKHLPAWEDSGKSYVSNWEIYSHTPYFDAEEWFKSCGVI